MEEKEIEYDMLYKGPIIILVMIIVNIHTLLFS